MTTCKNCLHVSVCGRHAATGGHIRECDQFASDWIPVSERLPECECIAIGFQSEMLIGWVGADANSDTGYCAESDGEILGNVTHWMPLPEPPKGVER